MGQDVAFTMRMSYKLYEDAVKLANEKELSLACLMRQALRIFIEQEQKQKN